MKHSGDGQTEHPWLQDWCYTLLGRPVFCNCVQTARQGHVKVSESGFNEASHCDVFFKVL